MKKRYYIISGILAYLVFLIISIPAAPVLAQLQSQLPMISIQGVSGSLWNGSAAAITFQRQHTLTDTDWQFNAWRLLTGELSAQINTQYQRQPISAELGVNPMGKLHARNLSASIDAAALAELAKIPLAQLSGKIELQLDQLEWQPRQVPRATGTLQWHSAAVTVADTAELGEVLINITENDTHALHLSISNQEGQIKLEGEANVGEDGAYSLQLNLLPNQSASSNVRNSLGIIAKPKPGGSYQLDNSGNLKQFGLM